MCKGCLIDDVIANADEIECGEDVRGDDIAISVFFVMGIVDANRGGEFVGDVSVDGTEDRPGLVILTKLFAIALSGLTECGANRKAEKRLNQYVLYGPGDISDHGDDELERSKRQKSSREFRLS